MKGAIIAESKGEEKGRAVVQVSLVAHALRYGDASEHDATSRALQRAE